MGPWIKLKVAQENGKSDHWSLRELFIGHIYAAFCARGLPVGVSVHSNGLVYAALNSCRLRVLRPLGFTNALPTPILDRFLENI